MVVEIGPGSGEQLVSYAKSHPDRNVLAFEAWHVAVARCVANAVRNDVTNVRIVEADAAQALPVVFADPATPRARELWTFFPDPWRKKRHRKRRLVAGPFVAQAAGVLKSGGLWRLATDWDDYAWQMRDELEDSDSFANLYAGQRLDPATRAASRRVRAPVARTGHDAVRTARGRRRPHDPRPGVPACLSSPTASRPRRTAPCPTPASTAASPPTSTYPFCAVRCGYCDFNTYTNLRMGTGASVDDFPGSLAGEIALSRRVLRGEGRLSTRRSSAAARPRCSTPANWEGSWQPSTRPSGCAPERR